MDERTRRVAENEILFRQVNERVRGIAGASPAGTVEIICECGETTCMDRVRVKAKSYERTRSAPADFLLKPGHDKQGFETVIETHEEFLLVRKVGEAGELAKRRDPRP